MPNSSEHAACVESLSRPKRSREKTAWKVQVTSDPRSSCFTQGGMPAEGLGDPTPTSAAKRRGGPPPLPPQQARDDDRRQGQDSDELKRMLRHSSPPSP